MGCTPLINARSSIVLRFSGRHLASNIVQDHLRDCITLKNGSGRGPPTDGRFSRPMVSARRYSCTGPQRRATVSDAWSRAAARHRGQRRRKMKHRRSGAECTSTWGDSHRGQNIGEAHRPGEERAQRRSGVREMAGSPCPFAALRLGIAGSVMRDPDDEDFVSSGAQQVYDAAKVRWPNRK